MKIIKLDYKVPVGYNINVDDKIAKVIFRISYWHLVLFGNYPSQFMIY